MKNFTLAVALLITFSVQSQIGMGTPNPDASAVLELASTQKGFLPPRLTTQQRNAIVQPAEGLTIYNTNKDCLEWYITTGWYNSCGDNPAAVVDNYTCNTLETGTMTEGIPVSGVSQTITATVSSPGTYDISATNNGITFSARGNFTSKGKHDIILHATNIGSRRYLLFEEYQFDKQEDERKEKHQDGNPVDPMHILEPGSLRCIRVLFLDIQIFCYLTHDAHNCFSNFNKNSPFLFRPFFPG